MLRPRIAEVVLPELVFRMRPSMERQLAGVSEGPVTSIHAADVRLVLRVTIHVFLEVLLKGELSAAVFADVMLLICVCVAMSLARELSSESSAAIRIGARIEPLGSGRGS